MGADLTWAENATPRTARKSYRCRCADEIVDWKVTYLTTSGSGTRFGFASQEDAQAKADALLGVPSNVNAGTGEVTGRYTETHAVPRINPNYAGRADDCAGRIEPGDRYVEYLGESAPWQSGDRYCWPCGVKVWGTGK